MLKTFCPFEWIKSSKSLNVARNNGFIENNGTKHPQIDLLPPSLAAEGVTVFKDEVGKEQEKGQHKYEMG